jgi:hypothetical protein
MLKPYVSLGLALFSFSATAQERKSPDVKLLTPAECAMITKRPQGDFYVTGPIKIGSLTISNQNVPKHGFVMDGIDNYDVIERSCFDGKPT